MGPLLLALALATPVPVGSDDWPAPTTGFAVGYPFRTGTDTIQFTGRFAPDGKVATMQLEIPWGSDAPAPIARILTDDCRSTASTLDHLRINPEPPLAVVDLDGDGRDEAFLYVGGATLDAAAIIRTEGCRVVAVRKGDEAPANLSFHGRGQTCMDCGVGIFCKRTAQGTVEILAIGHESWTEGNFTGDEPVFTERHEVPWERTTYALRGDSLVATASDTGTTRVHHDPSVPLLNRFECLGAVYPRD